MSGRPKKQRRAEARAREAKAVREALDLDITFTHYRLLWSADWACLPELLGSVKTHGFPTDHEWPSLPLREARRAFLELVDAGFVDIFDKDGTPVPNAKARRMLDKDAPWAENNPDSPNYFEVWGSDRGAEVLHAFELELGHVGAVKNRR